MTTHFVKETSREERVGAEQRPSRMQRSFAAESLAAVVGVVLAIIGLAGAASRILDTIAVIALGAAFLCERWAALQPGRAGSSALGDRRGLTLDSIAGWAGIALGVLSLLRLAPTVLVPVAVIIFGAALAFGAGERWRSARTVAGVVAIVLGILALARIDPRTLSLIGLIVVGGALVATAARPVGAMFAGHSRRAAA